MAQFRATLRVVKSYLDYCGFRVEDMSEVWDGHRLLGWCEHYLMYDVCPCAVEVSVHHLMKKLEGDIGQPGRVVEATWNRTTSNVVLTTHGFQPITD